MNHGTNSGYVSGCRCDACRHAHNAYAKRRIKVKAMEEAGARKTYFVDAQPVRDYVSILVEDNGWSMHEIERIADLDRGAVGRLFSPHWRTGEPVRKMKRETAEAIMAVGGTRCLAPGQLVSAAWMAEMLKRWTERSMSIAEVSRRTGVDKQCLYAISRGKQKSVTALNLRRFYEKAGEINAELLMR